MKNFKFLVLFFFIIIFTVPSCDLIGGLFPDDNTDTVTNDNNNNNNDDDDDIHPGDVLSLNVTYKMSIQAGDGNGSDGDHYFFIAGNGEHTITTTKLTTDVDMELYAWDGSQTAQEITDEYDHSPFFLYDAFEVGLDPETISISLTSGEQYLLYFSEWDSEPGTFDLLIKNP